MENDICCSKGPEDANSVIGNLAVMEETPTALLSSFNPDTSGWYSGAIRKPSPNYWQGRNGRKVKAICYHGTGSPVKKVEDLSPTITDVDITFANPTRPASTHFAVARNLVKGREVVEVHQYVSIWDCAWGNGIVTTYDKSIGWLATDVDRGLNPNWDTISIETHNIGDNSAPLSEAQYTELVKLVRWIMSQCPEIPTTEQGHIGHFQIDLTGRERCPGKHFDWDRLMKDIQRNTTPAPQPNFPTFYFKETDKYVDDERGFLSYWQNNGGLKIFGFPISGARFNPGTGFVEQWFERACFEYHPNEGDKVQLRLIGAELLAKG